jgi:hypothetical protein
MSNEPHLERIQQLEHQVRRWRKASLGLAFLLICVVAVAGAYMIMPPTQEHGNFWLFLPWVRARVAREEAIRAELEVRALQAADAARKAVDAAKRAKDEGANKQP